jgi:hypothetical protein
MSSIANRTEPPFFPSVRDEDSSDMFGHRSSPLYEIIQELKRKNSVIAAASAGTHPITMFDNVRSDPWGSSSDDMFGAVLDDDSTTGLSIAATCTCHNPNRRSFQSIGSRARRRPSWDVRYSESKKSVGFSNPARNTSGTYDASSEAPQDFGEVAECPDCGKPYSTDARNIRRSSRTELQILSAIHNPISPRQLRMNYWLDSPRIERLEAPQHADALLQVAPRLRIIIPASTDMNVAYASSSNNIFGFLLPAVTPPTNQNVSQSDQKFGRVSQNSSSQGRSNTLPDYNESLKRDRANQLAAEELASLLWTCAHEMSLEDFGIVESETFSCVFGLIHSSDSLDRRMAGMAALDALIDAPSADEEKKAIKFANTLSGGLRTAHGNFEFLSVISKALGHMARKNVDFVESEISRALEWLRTERSDRR